jgi:membrane-bound lytic murein transglycosylase D
VICWRRLAGYSIAVLATSVLLACAPNQASNGLADVQVQEAPVSDTLSFAEWSLRFKVSDSLAMRPSWENYQYALQAMDNQEWNQARRYLNRSLRNLVTEHFDSTYANVSPKEDSLYRLKMSVLLVRALDEVYPNEVTGADEGPLDGIFQDESVLADSASLMSLEDQLDSLDVNEFTLPIKFNERVLQEVFYLTSKAKSFTEGSLSRKTAYDSLVYAKLAEHNMPRDLIFLSLVESGFKVKAYSRAKASGLWQFIPETGKRYGLSVDYWVDMRRNPEMATEAALNYLSYLYNEFGDWLLAMAAYNCGEGRIRREIREWKADSTHDTTQAVTYWDLELPKETMHYVPRILAAMVIGHYPEQYDITVKQTYRPQFDTVTVFDSFSLEEVAKLLKVPEDTLRTLNMELVMWCTPPNVDSYLLRLPFGTRSAFVEGYDRMQKNSFSSWHHHRVKKGENLGAIAKQYGITVTELKLANNLKNDRVRQGKTLLIPIKVSPKKSSGKKPLKVRTYVVELSDNLASIARQFGVSQESLRIWNQMEPTAVVKPGDTIFVSKPELKPAGEVKKIELKKGERYVVGAGDTYANIAEALSIPTRLLMEANSGFIRRLTIGDSLVIPAYTPPKKPAKSEPKADSKKDDKKAEKAKKTAEKVAPTKGNTYVVESGDNLYYIAKKFSCTVDDLMAWNGLTNSNIHPGDTLVVRGSKNASKDKPAEKADGFITYTVKQGDSLYDLAKSYKTTKEDIMKWNGLKDTKIKPGDKLKIKKP